MITCGAVPAPLPAPPRRLANRSEHCQPGLCRLPGSRKLRKLGIPVVADKAVQAALKLALAWQNLCARLSCDTKVRRIGGGAHALQASWQKSKNGKKKQLQW
jgi:retron-type reverse transcriptase